MLLTEYVAMGELFFGPLDVSSDSTGNSPAVSSKTLSDWQCADCQETFTGIIQHRGKGKVPVCCLCWELGAGDCCSHPLFA